MNYGSIIALIVILVIVLAVCIGIVVAINTIRNRVQDVSRTLFGTSSFIDGYNEQKQQMSETPRSLHAMTSIFLPQIQSDFPEFDYELYKNKAETMLKSYFTAIETKNTTELKEECSITLQNNVQQIIADLDSRKINQYFNETVLHNTQISNYLKNGATATIRFDIAVGCITYGENADGSLAFGDKTFKKQTVYEVELVYVQDASKIDEMGDSLGVHCPNCGAPVTNLGVKFCEYCGAGIKEINLRAWAFDSVREQTVGRKQY